MDSGIKVSQLSITEMYRLVNALGGDEIARQVLRGEVKVFNPIWHERDEVIYLTVTTDGISGSEWAERLKNDGFALSEKVERLLRSDDFISTTGVKTNIAILKGSLFNDSGYGYHGMCLCQKYCRATRKIAEAAKERKLIDLNVEIACLMRAKLSDREIAEMGLGSIVVMHEPFEILRENPRKYDSKCWQGVFELNKYNSHSLDLTEKDYNYWPRDTGFAFKVAAEV